MSRCSSSSTQRLSQARIDTRLPACRLLCRLPHAPLAPFSAASLASKLKLRFLCPVTVNLNVAVVGFTLLFYGLNVASKKFEAFKSLELSDLSTISLDEDSARV